MNLYLCDKYSAFVMLYCNPVLLVNKNNVYTLQFFFAITKNFNLKKVVFIIFMINHIEAKK